ncbi:tyrosine--tRNA ligase [Candidatus Wolfebacteria bacterium]|nr:MAG: tyrosine--tRNA ligase [Candidatus Wolfebacteria bacterium]
MKIDTTEQKIDELLVRGVSEVIDKKNLKKRLLSGEKLRIKLGIDPTSPHLHLGRAISILKLRDLQEMGHEIIFLIGDFTGVIGDTSDKESERPMLSTDDIKKNMETYFEQAGKLLDISKVEKVYNSEWLSKLTYKEIGEQADAFSVADFIARENIKKRLDGGKRVSLREVLYPLMQGYDSVAIRADVELGGTDQRFNLLAGRTLQEKEGQIAQDIIMMDLIAGLDGRKMSSSWGNTINLTDSATDMYGKVMSMRDETIPEYFIACTRVPMNEVDDLITDLKDPKNNPRDIKARLAREIVTIYYDADQALKAEEDFKTAFVKGGIPSSIPEISVAQGTLLVAVLLEQGLIDSKTEFRRLIDAGAISNLESEEKIKDPHTTISKTIILRVGKARFIKIVV